MSKIEVIQLIFFALLLMAGSPLLGFYMARVFEGKPAGINRIFGSVERFIYKVAGIKSQDEMSWTQYLWAVILFNVLGGILTMGQMMMQTWLPLNPQHLPNIPFPLALNTAISFMTNTNAQAYAGESTMSYLTQVLGLGVHDFTSAATGIAVFLALIRGFARRQASTLGNFWTDLVRSILYVLLPLSCVFSLLLVSQGVIQNFRNYDIVKVMVPWMSSHVQGGTGEQSLHPVDRGLVMENQRVIAQVIPQGPVASFVAIKQLGSNGGGYFGQNSAHPFENPTPFSNFLEMFAILLIPSSLVFTFGFLLGNIRQSIALWLTMISVFALFFAIAWHAELQPNPVTGIASSMVGKEQRFGIMNSLLWAISTTSTSNGSVNAMHDSLSPVAGFMTLLNLQLGCVIFGGVGVGMYGMLHYVMLTVFLAGLMIGRTPEYLGKKIEASEIRWSIIMTVCPAGMILIGSAIAIRCSTSLQSLCNQGPHGLSEILYAFSTCVANNGSAFQGLSTNIDFYNYFLALAMFIGRFISLVSCLAIAGSLVRKNISPVSSGTLATSGPFFSALLISVFFLTTALTFFPVLCLGPIVEQLLMLEGHGF